jgi:cation transport regulator
MADSQLNELPSEVTEKLPQAAQQIFRADLNSAQKDGLSEEAATRVAWNSVKQAYQPTGDGSW